MLRKNSSDKSTRHIIGLFAGASYNFIGYFRGNFWNRVRQGRDFQRLQVTLYEFFTNSLYLALKIKMYSVRATLSHVTMEVFALMTMVQQRVNVNLDSSDWTVLRIHAITQGKQSQIGTFLKKTSPTFSCSCWEGECKNGECQCPDGFFGDYCENRGTACGDSFCFNGNCTESVACLCDLGFSGNFCEIDQCDLIHCGNYGTCIQGYCHCEIHKDIISLLLNFTRILYPYSDQYCQYMESGAPRTNPSRAIFLALLVFFSFRE